MISASIINQKPISITPQEAFCKAHTWDEAAHRWIIERHNKKTIKDDKIKLIWLERYLSNKQLKDINSDLLSTIAYDRYHAKGRYNNKAHSTNATVIRYLTLIRSILIACRDEWKYIDRIPEVKDIMKKYKDQTQRIRFLSQQEFQRLYKELPKHLRDMSHLAVLTGLRSSNIKLLEWSEVDLGARAISIPSQKMKTKKPLTIPINSEAVNVLLKWKRHQSRYVFHYQGNAPIGNVMTKAWYKACLRARIDDFTFHDLRHTWASWHSQNGTPMNVLQMMGGWSKSEMVQRYAHLNIEHMEKYSSNIKINKD